MPSLPLSGLRVLVTRSRTHSSDLSTRLRYAGAEPVEVPLIQIVDPEDWTPLDQALADLDGYDWLIFTSGNAVEKCLTRLEATNVQIPPSLRIASVGSATVKRLRQFGLIVDYTPDRYDAEALVEGLVESYELSSAKVLFPCADIARQTVVTDLTGLGAEVTSVTAYRTVLANSLPSEILALLRCKGIHVITFTSPSTVEAFVQATQNSSALLSEVTIACIGPETARKSKEAGIVVDIVPEEASIEALVEALVEALKGRMGME
ncbi:MAG: uroporphyrinogen-III synthase [Gemmatimonadota bacterium]|nr:uroporphyrinogen-III synthase [Gemmatimonadota bacterium]